MASAQRQPYSLLARKESTPAMMTILAMILSALWLIGVATGSTGGGIVHLLLAAALAVVLIQFVRGWLACDGTPLGKGKP